MRRFYWGGMLLIVGLLGGCEQEKEVAPTPADEVAQAIQTLQAGASWTARWVAVDQLDRARDKRAVEPLLTLLQEEWQEVSRAVANLLAAFASKDSGKVIEARKHLATHLDGSKSIIRTLGHLGDPRATQPLLDLARRTEPQVQAWQEQVRSRKLEPLVVGDLLKTLGDVGMHLRYAVVLALGDIGGNLTSLLLPFLDDEQWRVRYAAVQVLGHTGDPKIVSPLVQLIRREVEAAQKNPDYTKMVLYAARQALVDVGAAARPQLLAMLQDDQEGVCETAAWALGEMQDPQAVPALIAFLRADPFQQAEERYFRAASTACWALRMIGTPEALAAAAEAEAKRRPRAVFEEPSAPPPARSPLAGMKGPMPPQEDPPAGHDHG